MLNRSRRAPVTARRKLESGQAFADTLFVPIDGRGARADGGVAGSEVVPINVGMKQTKR